MGYLDDFRRLTAPLRKAIQLMVGRAIVTYINNSGGTQTIQLQVLADEILQDVEKIQWYGFESTAPIGAEAVLLSVQGNREQGLVIGIHDRRYRPRDVAAGDSKQYTSFGNYVHLKAADGEIDVSGVVVNISAAGKVTIDTSSEVEISAVGDVNISTTVGNIIAETTLGNIQIGGAGGKLIARVGDSVDMVPANPTYGKIITGSPGLHTCT